MDLSSLGLERWGNAFFNERVPSRLTKEIVANGINMEWNGIEMDEKIYIHIDFLIHFHSIPFHV